MRMMRSFSNRTEFLAFLNGRLLCEGTEGETTSGQPDFQDDTTDAFAAAAEGDTIFVAGEGTFTILTKTDANNLVLDGNLSATDTGVHWKITRNYVEEADIFYVGPGPGGVEMAVVFDTNVFTVPS